MPMEVIAGFSTQILEKLFHLLIQNNSSHPYPKTLIPMRNGFVLSLFLFFSTLAQCQECNSSLCHVKNKFRFSVTPGWQLMSGWLTPYYKGTTGFYGLSSQLFYNIDDRWSLSVGASYVHPFGIYWQHEGYTMLHDFKSASTSVFYTIPLAKKGRYCGLSLHLALTGSVQDFVVTDKQRFEWHNQLDVPSLSLAPHLSVRILPHADFFLFSYGIAAVDFGKIRTTPTKGAIGFVWRLDDDGAKSLLFNNRKGLPKININRILESIL
jgi:hypothetical protein